MNNQLKDNILVDVEEIIILIIIKYITIPVKIEGLEK